MAVTSSNVVNVKIVGGNIVLYESGGVSTAVKRHSIDNVISFLGSTDSNVQVRKECHAALREAGFTGSLGGFGG